MSGLSVPRGPGHHFPSAPRGILSSMTGSCCISRLSILLLLPMSIIISTTPSISETKYVTIFGFQSWKHFVISWICAKLAPKCDLKMENWSFYPPSKEPPPPYMCITKGRAAQNGLELLILIPALYWMALWLGFLHPRTAAYSSLSTLWNRSHLKRNL